MDVVRSCRFAFAIAIAFAAWSLLAGTAHALPLKVTASVHRGHGARTVTVTSRTAARATCGLLVRAHQASQALPFLQADRRGRATWTWSAAAAAPGGRWRFSVHCAHGRHSTTRAVARSAGRGGRSRLIGEPDTFRALRGTVIASPKVSDPKGLGGDPNPFPWHQCTWWAWVKRADVYEAGKRAGIPAHGSRGVHQGQRVYIWDGAQWFPNAQRAGLPTGQTPMAGALASWGEYPGNPYGHVAYVEEAPAPNHIRISECNGFTLVCGDRWVDPNRMKGRLEGYVYGGPAQTPGTPAPGPAPGAPRAAPSLTITGMCSTTSGVLNGTSSGFTPGGTATIRAWYPNGSEYTNLVHVSRVRADGSIGWTWPCAGDPSGAYATEVVDDASGASTGRVTFVIGGTQPAPVTSPPPVTPPPVAPPRTYSEQQGHHGVNTFTNYHNASGPGPRIDPGAWVQVSCKVHDGTIASVNPDGYWYRIASAPWNNAYYSPANTFMNGDPWNGPYTHNTDFAVPDC